MKKKLVALMLVTVMGMSTLTGCAHVFMNAAREEYEKETVEKAEELYNSTTEEYAEDTEEVTEDLAEDTEATADDSADAKGDTTASSSSATVDFEVAEGTLDNPAKLGEWVATKTYCVETDDYRTIYYRITGIIRGEEAQKVVDQYNSEDHYSKFDELEYDDLEFCVVTYETHYPTDFPEGEYGLYEAEVDLYACNLEDSGSIEGYIGLSSVWDISEEPEEFHAGDTFTEGKAVFAMVKGFSDYLLYAGYYDDDSNEINTYVKPEQCKAVIIYSDTKGEGLC